MVADVLGFIDVLIRFWSQKVKVTVGSGPKTVYSIFVPNYWS